MAMGLLRLVGPAGAPQNSRSVCGCCWSASPSSAVVCAGSCRRWRCRRAGGAGLSWAGNLGSSSHLALALSTTPGTCIARPGRVQPVEGLDVGVRRWLLHPDGGPARPDGQHHLQLPRHIRLVPNLARTLRLLLGILVVVLPL